MKINYEINLEDYIEFNLHHLMHSKTVQKSLWKQRIVVSLIYLILPFLISYFFNLPLLWYLITFSLASILWFLFFPKYFYRSAKNKMIKHLSEKDDHVLFGEHLLKIDENGMKEITQSSVHEIKWDNIVEVKGTIGYFYIYFSSMQAIIIPLEAIKDDMEKLMHFYRENNIQLSYI
ncbi:YcxB family protein [Gottfriedia luciferensis]|uniref:YcxB family protein n=1 Tax=Gottfriedia luciferensis TaxID=178774 RepID=UPI000B4545C8|nr:YcxB family protein [Gottfriedia luciferensis]